MKYTIDLDYAEFLTITSAIGEILETNTDYLRSLERTNSYDEDFVNLFFQTFALSHLNAQLKLINAQS